MRARRAKTAVWPAPVKGLIRNGALIGSSPDAAEVLTNFFPTGQGARLRGGSRLFATAGASVGRLLTYRSGTDEKLFAATQTDVFDVSAVVDPLVPPAASLSGLNSGDWSFVQFATPGGQFLVMASGADPVQNYNGAAWSAPAITGVSPSALSFVWSHKKRLWFVEGGTLSAWSLAVNSIAGVADIFPLDGVFRLGGALLFGATWSLDSGDGLDDMMVFATTEGEIAVYQGTDPAADFQLTGVYKIGRPLNKHSWFRAGGDLCIITEDGIVPISAAVQKDVAALQTSAITFPIEDLWREAVSNNSIAAPFASIVWPTQTLFFVGVPTATGQFAAIVSNTRTGAWAQVSGWDMRCMAIFGGALYFGTEAGEVLKADVGGEDAGLSPSYTGYYVPKFQDFGTPQDKTALHARALWKSDGGDKVELTCFSNYSIGAFPIPETAGEGAFGAWGDGSVWGDGSIWGPGTGEVVGSDWQAVSGSGFALAPALVVGSNRTDRPQFELSSIHLRYEQGREI